MKIENSMNHYVIHTDGGSRGNPGAAAIGVVIEGTGLPERKEYGEYIGITTNNIAEYEAVLFALKKVKQLIGSEKASHATLEVYTDSELVVKQLTGKYKVKEPDIQERFLAIWNLRLDFQSVVFHHVVRERNKGADKMVNYALDREERKLV